MLLLCGEKLSIFPLERQKIKKKLRLRRKKTRLAALAGGGRGNLNTPPSASTPVGPRRAVDHPGGVCDPALASNRHNLADDGQDLTVDGSCRELRARQSLRQPGQLLQGDGCRAERVDGGRFVIGRGVVCATP